jgi:hypothetical protein
MFDFNREPIEIKIPRNLLVENVQDNYASEFYRRLVEWISDFDNSLDNDSEVGVRLVNFGQTVVFSLEDMGYYDPSLILFKGHTQDGSPVELIQHVSQISILLMKLPRKNPEQPKKPLGFQVVSNNRQGEDNV